MVKEVTSHDEYKSLISEGKPVAVDFFATWCGPCQVIGPKFAALASSYSGVTFIKVDVDKAEEIAQTEDISAMPTFIFYQGGKKVETVVGANESSIKAALDKLK